MKRTRYEGKQATSGATVVVAGNVLSRVGCVVVVVVVEKAKAINFVISEISA